MKSLFCIVLLLLVWAYCYAQEEGNEEIMVESEGLVVEGKAQRNTQDKLGRSFSLAENEIQRTAQTGVVEDLMTSIKQLPGVGYTGTFDARPSVRGSDPEDFVSVFNGFYIEYPFHWDGSMSIFDPRMIENVELSHGVFSARYGKTCAGLLQVTSKKPNYDSIQAELSLSTSATDMLLNVPFKNGGILGAGRVTYLDGYVNIAKLFTDSVKFVEVAPYIRNMLLDAGYNFSNNVYYNASAFLGNDGLKFSLSGLSLALDSLQGFFIQNLQIVPSPQIFIETSLGAGFYNSKLTGDNSMEGIITGSDSTEPMARKTKTSSIQFNSALDFFIGSSFVLSAGIEEQLLFWNMANDIAPNENQSDVQRQGLWTSPFMLLEWTSKKQIIKTETGIRLDHLLFSGINTPLAINPRFNIDITILRNKHFVDSLVASAATGLFSALPRNVASYNEDVTFAEESNGALDLRQTSSWTSITGLALNFLQNYSFTVEAYYKNVQHRWYKIKNYHFDGMSKILGVDLMLRRFESRFVDGWISYSYNFTNNKDGESDIWYFPLYHRFHTLNVNANFKITRSCNISVHFAYASGRYLNEYSEENNEERQTSPVTLDIKFSKYFLNKSGRSSGEFYVAVENLISAFKSPDDAMEGFNVNFQLPIPIPSFGVKLSY